MFVTNYALAEPDLFDNSSLFESSVAFKSLKSTSSSNLELLDPALKQVMINVDDQLAHLHEDIKLVRKSQYQCLNKGTLITNTTKDTNKLLDRFHNEWNSDGKHSDLKSAFTIELNNIHNLLLYGLLGFVATIAIASLNMYLESRQAKANGIALDKIIDILKLCEKGASKEDTAIMVKQLESEIAKQLLQNHYAVTDKINEIRFKGDFHD